MPPGDADSAALAMQVGQLAGVVQTSHQATMHQLNLIREDMHRMEDNHRKEMSSMEERFNKRVDGIEDRVEQVEKTQQSMAIDSAKQGVITGGLAGSLTYLAIEFIKKIGHF